MKIKLTIDGTTCEAECDWDPSACLSVEQRETVNAALVRRLTDELHILGEKLIEAKYGSKKAADSVCPNCGSDLKVLVSHKGRRIVTCPKCGPINLQVVKS